MLQEARGKGLSHDDAMLFAWRVALVVLVLLGLFKVALAPVGNAVFPSAVDPKYAKESAGKARMHTCVDQYNANKASNGNGGLKWIEKGGGYYSECNKRLKGTA